MPLSDTAARQAKFTGEQQKLSDEKVIPPIFRGIQK